MTAATPSQSVARSRRRRRILAALAGLLVMASLAAPAPAATAQAPATLLDYRHRTELAVFDPRSLAIRWIAALVDIDRTALPTLPREAAETMLLVWRDKGELWCNCTAHLGRDEVVVSAEPVRDSLSGLAVSIDETTYRTFAVEAGYPLTALEPIAATMANLAYVDNDAPLRAWLDEQGFVLDYAYGMYNAGGLVNPRNLHLFVAHRRASGDVYIAVRGTGDLGDMITNFSTRMVPWLRGGHVHEGYEEAALAAAELIRPVIARLHKEWPDAPLYATGHSLGAAIAGLISIDLANLVPIRTLGMATPPLGDAAFATREAAALGRVDSYFVAHDEIRSLDRLARSHNLEWVGHEVDLGDIGQTAGSYHLVINYLKGMLAIRQIPVAAFEHAIPICTLKVLPCFTDRHALLPLCVFESADCLDRSWPAMAAWLDQPAADAEARRDAARRLQRDLVAGKILADLKPFVLVELAAWHGSGDAAVGLRFLDSAGAQIGDSWLLRQIRQRLLIKAAAMAAGATGRD